MKLKEFRNLSKAEICNRINLQLKQENHSTKKAMEANGYEFSWTSMRKEALASGLVEGFFDPTGEITNVDISSYSPVREVQINLNRDREEKVRRTYSFDKEDVDELDLLLKDFIKSSDKSEALSVIFKLGLQELVKAAKADKIKIVRPTPELNFEK